jgi:hypothetical protein
MSPIGPEPPVVYWIRRAAVIVALLTVILASVWVIQALRHRGASSAAAAASASASASTGSGAPAPSDSAAASGAPADGTVPACPDAVIKVEATTNSATYPVGSTPKLTLAISNTGPAACSRDVGPAANSLEVTSGGYHVWSTDDCTPSTKTKVSTLEPGQKVVASITWAGKLSTKGCPDGPDGGADAKVGRYAVIGKNGAVSSDTTPFALTKN